MKHSAYLTLPLVLAAAVVASPTRKAKCGYVHGNASSSLSSDTYPMTSSPASSSGYLGSAVSTCYVYQAPTVTSSAAGTVCTVTSTAVETSTQTASTTTTPAVVTTITTTLETTTQTTTESQSTDIFSTTSTVFETTTNTQTATATATATTTTTITTAPPTTTLATGYTAVKSVFASSNPEKRNGQQQPGTTVTITASHGLCTSTATQTSTSSETTTVTNTTEAPTPTSTQVSTSTVTTVSTVLQTPASSTTTIMTTETLATTTTVTETTTTTSTASTTTLVGPTPTVWAPCVDSANFMSKVSGEAIEPDSFQFYGTNDGVIASSATDCCNKCHELTGGNCSGALFLVDGLCDYFVPQTCNSASKQVGFFTTTNPRTVGTVINGGCGQWGRAGEI
ncbi:hypothetical protein MN608_00403 [Microdochium nivale]|nr:hypothetical protein MN608_00403 [Microdochium nivale]